MRISRAFPRLRVASRIVRMTVQKPSIPIIVHANRTFHARLEDSLLAQYVGIGVKVREKENIDRALRRFKRTVNRSRVLRLYRANMSFTKPSEERRMAKEKALRNARKHNRRY